MLYAEVFVYSDDRVGMMEYPGIRWGDLVTGHDIFRIKLQGLEACLRGEKEASSKVWLRTTLDGRSMPLCEADVTIDIYDLRPLVGTPLRKTPRMDYDRNRSKRWSLAPTIDELRTMIQKDLPQMAEAWRDDGLVSEG